MLLLLSQLASLLSLAIAPSPGTSRPFEALAELEPLLRRYRALPARAIPAEDALLLLARAADAYTAARSYANLTLLRAEIVALETAPSKLLLARVALVEALTFERRFEEALGVLAAAEGAALALPTSTAKTGLAAGLLRSRAQVLDCKGDGRDALEAFEQGLPSLPWPPPQGLTSAALTRLTKTYLLLLRRAGLHASERALRAGAALLEAGPWTRVDQLPKHFHPQLPTRPFWDAENPPWELGGLAAALKRAAPALLREFRSLQAARAPFLLPEAECINDPHSGLWTYATVNAPWVQHVDEDLCATSTPVACKLLRRARKEGWGGTALRGTYSTVAGGGVLRAHCGLSNAQIKFHVGLAVPRRVEVGGGGVERSLPCAFLTVANETRAWGEGKVLLFSDSYEHAVENLCPHAERVVFQLVLPHGDARGKELDGAVGPQGD